eukprot:GFYU01011293.1.p1 GENE.GFYU01011293.1~~GFYU01011293.1.p1  ORF type:complete len:138 (-),score=16.74 GFYU01011293.1:124-537(-)
MQPGLFSLLIVNKSGGLIYLNNFAPNSSVTTNDYLRLASTFDSIYAIASNISPVPGSSGIQLLEADTFKLHCFHTVTGLKFFVLADPTAKNVDSALQTIYQLYTDYVLKNPFYTVEMPIRCDLFDQQLDRLFKVATE